MNGVRGLLGGAVCIGLAGCAAETGHADLEAYLDAARTQATVQLEPAPTLRPVPTLSYGASALRSPFQIPLGASVADRQGAAVPGMNDPARVREPLEGFDIEQLQMVGTLSGTAGSFVLLRGGGVVYRLRIGDYLGRDQGRIVAIGDSRVDVVEVVPDGAGAWLERSRTLALKTHS
ncbi:pilus assembly protein PilP [Pseudomonas sp. ABAC61]|nr:pilus assembly protein PilP [Pseudomonas sp. ABAC61]